MDLRLPAASFTEAKQFEDDSLSSPGQETHAGLQLLVPPLEPGVQRPQVLDGRHIQEVVLGQPCVERLEFIWNKINSQDIVEVSISNPDRSNWEYTILHFKSSFWAEKSAYRNTNSSCRTSPVRICALILVIFHDWNREAARKRFKAPTLKYINVILTQVGVGYNHFIKC